MRYTLINDFDRAFNGLWNSNFALPTRFQNPQCEVTENENAYFLSFDVPGIKKEDIKIELKDSRLTVSGERKRAAFDNRQVGELQEKFYGYFERSFTLPETAQDDKIEARFEDGVLEIAVPKKEETKARRIDIQTGAGGGFFSKLLEGGKAKN